MKSCKFARVDKGPPSLNRASNKSVLTVDVCPTLSLNKILGDTVALIAATKRMLEDLVLILPVIMHGCE